MSKTSTSANRLNSTAFPSITGLPASAPMSPSPSTAVPLLTTATRFPRAVFKGIVRIRLDLQTGHGDARGVRQAEIALCAARLAGSDFDLPGPLACVVSEDLMVRDRHRA